MQFAWVIGIGTALALGLSAVSLALTQRTEWKVAPRDTRPLILAAEGVQSELDRLHSRYSDQLNELAEEVRRARGNTFGPGRMAAKLVGVRTVSVLDLERKEESIHLEIIERAGGEPPFERDRFPSLAFGSDQGNAEIRILDRNEFGDSSLFSGWLRESGDVFYFWKRLPPSSVVLIGVDALSVRSAVGAWLAEREDLSVHRIQSGAGEFTRFIGPDGAEILSSGNQTGNGRSPRVFPATIRFGTWQIQAWNAVESSRSWNLPYLIVGQFLSLILLAATVVVALALRRATRLAERRVSFVNSASHELRSPITNMMLNVDLARELTSDDPEAANQRLDRVHDEAGRLSRLVDNLLTFSRSGEGGDVLHLEHKDPDRILEETLEHFAALLERREIVVDWERGGGISLDVDPDALAQIFGNLISNVEKYAAKGKSLRIVTELVDGMWTADFIDKGPGVSRKFAGRIFEPFRRVTDRVTEGVSGTGLGLTISRELARRLGGELDLVSSGEGAVFRLTLPIPKS